MGGGVRYLLCTFVYEREAIRTKRVGMHANVGVEYECDVSYICVESMLIAFLISILPACPPKRFCLR